MLFNGDKKETALAMAKGLGTTHHGVTHWWHQRVTAIAAIPLTFWLVWATINRVVGASYEDFSGWLAVPHNTILMILAVIAIFYHAALGTQVIVEDYFKGWMKWVGLLKIKYYFLAAATICIFAILKIAFTG